jgi:hypothetical protein
VSDFRRGVVSGFSIAANAIVEKYKIRMLGIRKNYDKMECNHNFF